MLMCKIILIEEEEIMQYGDRAYMETLEKKVDVREKIIENLLKTVDEIAKATHSPAVEQMHTKSVAMWQEIQALEVK